MKGRNFVIVAHKFNTTAGDDLVAYLNDRRADNVLFIWHSFSDAPDRRGYCRWYRRGRLVREKRTRDYRWLPEPLIYLKELLFTLRWVIGSSITWDRYIGMDGLCTLFGLVLRTGRRVRSVNFWNVDFVPSGRFPRRWKDQVYRRVNRFSAMHTDEMWDHTLLMVTEKERILRLRPADYRSHRVVPLGVWTDRIHRLRYDDCDQQTLVFMGHLLEKQGVQLVLRAVPTIVERIPHFRFKVIGGGAFEGDLRRLVATLNVDPYVNFLGRIEDDRDLEREVAQCAAGVAPYIRSLDTFTQFGADPGKIKTYLGCGLPILLTDVPWIAPEIQARGCGEIISEDVDDIAVRISRMLMSPELNQRCRDNAAGYALEFNYRRIFDSISGL